MQAINPSRRHLLFTLEIDERPSHHFGQMSERHVLSDAEPSDDTLGASLGGQVADADANRIGGSVELRRNSVNEEFAVIGWLRTKQRAAQPLPPRALHTGNAEYLAGSEVEAHCLKLAPAAELANAEAHRTAHPG